MGANYFSGSDSLALPQLTDLCCSWCDNDTHMNKCVFKAFTICDYATTLFFGGYIAPVIATLCWNKMFGLSLTFTNFHVEKEALKLGLPLGSKWGSDPLSRGDTISWTPLFWNLAILVSIGTAVLE